MEPTTRIAFEYPVYAMDLLDDGSIAVAGGGGKMKSGIPNACEVLSFDESTCTLSRKAAASLTDVPIALSVNGTTITTLIGSGCKNFVYRPPKQLSAESNFTHDLQVHTSIEQTAVAVSKNGSRLVIASDEGHLTVVELPYREMILGKQIHTQGVTDLSITEDGQLIATSARDHTAYISRTDSGELVQHIKPVMPREMHTHIRAIRFAPSQPSLIFTIESNPRKGAWIAAWRSANPAGGNWIPCAGIKASSDALTAFAISNTADVVAVSSAEGHVALFRWNGTSFTPGWTTEPGPSLFRPPPPPHVLPITSMHFSSSGTYLLTSSADYTIAAWRTRRPINWCGLLKLFLWIGILMIVLFSVLVAEDHHLPKGILKKRERAQPYLEPHLSGLQSNVRPVVKKGLEFTRPHYVKVCKAVRPYSDHVNQKVAPALRKSNELWNTCTAFLGENMEKIGGFKKALSGRIRKISSKKPSTKRASDRRTLKQKRREASSYPRKGDHSKKPLHNRQFQREGDSERNFKAVKGTMGQNSHRCDERSVWNNLILEVSEVHYDNAGVYSKDDAGSISASQRTYPKIIKGIHIREIRRSPGSSLDSGKMVPNEPVEPRQILASASRSEGNGRDTGKQRERGDKEAVQRFNQESNVYIEVDATSRTQKFGEKSMGSPKASISPSNILSDAMKGNEGQIPIIPSITQAENIPEVERKTAAKRQESQGNSENAMTGTEGDLKNSETLLRKPPGKSDTREVITDEDAVKAVEDEFATDDRQVISDEDAVKAVEEELGALDQEVISDEDGIQAVEKEMKLLGLDFEKSKSLETPKKYSVSHDGTEKSEKDSESKHDVSRTPDSGTPQNEVGTSVTVEADEDGNQSKKAMRKKNTENMKHAGQSRASSDDKIPEPNVDGELDAQELNDALSPGKAGTGNQRRVQNEDITCKNIL